MESKSTLPVSTDEPGAVAAIADFIDKIVFSKTGPETVMKAAALYPDVIFLQIEAAIFALFGQSRETDEQAFHCLTLAERCSAVANDRERFWLQVAWYWYRKSYNAALSSLETLLLNYPEDLLALKIAEWLYYCLGQAHCAKSYKILCESIADFHKDNSAFLSMYSFSLELCGQYHNAAETAEMALILDPKAAWAQHTLAHCYLKQSQFGKGIKLLEKAKTSWNDISPLLVGHNTWHLALFYLAQRKKDPIRALLEHSILAKNPDCELEYIDKIALLWRMDMAGFAEPNAMQAIAKTLAQKEPVFYTGFNAIHTSYALASLSEKYALQYYLDCMQRYALGLEDASKTLYWVELVYPFCQSIKAYSFGEYKTASDILKPIISRGFELGGSDAQDELFLQMYLLCLCKTGSQDARVFFKRYLSHYHGSPLETYWFS